MLAWRRLCLDRPDRCFYTPPYILRWLSSHLERWISSLSKKVSRGYTPDESITCYVPKSRWLVRPGSVLGINDELVLNAMLGKNYTNIYRHLKWSQGDPDIAYQLRKGKYTTEWIRSGFIVWREWREKSLEKLKGDISHVVFADITGFYDNIDLNILRSDLNGMRFHTATLELLMNCLNRWSKPKGRGIPQGYSASDILAKIYINPIDQGMRNAGYRHLRYVDDFRIFCRSMLEARKAILHLTELLRIRGLNLQAAKTEIIAREIAIQRIDGIAPVIEHIQDELKKEISEIAGYGSYATIDNLTSVLESNR